MASHETPTMEPVHPWEGAEPQIESVPPSPEQAHEAVINLDPHSKLSIAQQIEADAQVRGFDDLRGLRLELGEKGKLRETYVVRDTSIHKEPIVVEHAVGLPKFRGGLIRDGRLNMTRPRTRTNMKKVGLPRFVKYGSTVSFERREELIGDKDVPYAIVDIFDKDGMHVSSKSIRQSELFAQAGEHGLLQASWAERGEKPKDTGADLPIGLQPGESPYPQIEQQLAAVGRAGNWSGLTWTREDPYETHRPKSAKQKKRERYQAKAVPMTQEIVSDSLVKERDLIGTGYSWSRHFILRTTREGQDGSKSVEEVSLRDYELWRYLEEENDGLAIRNMRLPGAGTRHSKDAWAQDAWDSDQAWLGLSIPRDAKGKEIHDARSHNPAFRYLKDRLAQDQRTFHVPKEAGETGPWTRPSFHQALGILATRGTSYPRHNDEHGLAALSMRLAFMEDSKEESAYGEELQDVLTEVGIHYFNTVVKKLHDELYPELTTSEERLGLDIAPLDDDDTWIIESLLKRSRENREAGYEKPFTSLLAAPHIQRDLLDEHIGERFVLASLKIGESDPKPAGVDDKGQLRYKVDHKIEFNEDLFQNIPIISDNSRTNSVRKWHSKIWTPIRRLAEKLHDENREGEPIDYRELQKLGAMLRSAVPARSPRRSSN